MTKVVLKGVSKCYPNGFEAVHQVDLEINTGEFIVFVGPSGCGKSTVLRMIAGLEEISSGELKIGGERMNERPPKDRGVGMVFQSYALYPHMTVFENIAFGLRLQKLRDSEITQRVQQVAERLEIAELLTRKPKQMSGGQRQRVAMARAIARQPQIFLFDEPLSNLDAQLRAHMRVEIGRLHQELKATSLYVTHDQVEAMTLADRIVLLKSGYVQQVGAPLTLHDHPINRFVATFIGSPTMNLMSLKVITEEYLCSQQIRVPIPKELKTPLPLGDRVELGIRPYHIEVIPLDESHLDEVHCRVLIELVELLGSETLLHCVLLHHEEEAISQEAISQEVLSQESDERITVRLEKEERVQRGEVQRGEIIGLHFPARYVHLFCSDEEGRRLE